MEEWNRGSCRTPSAECSQRVTPSEEIPMLRLILDWQRARISCETIVPLGLAFQIAFNAVCISPKTPEAVTIRVIIPIIVAMTPDGMLAALATAVCKTSAVC